MCSVTNQVVLFYQSHPALLVPEHPIIQSTVPAWPLVGTDHEFPGRVPDSILGSGLYVAAPLVSRTESRGNREKLYRAGLRSQFLSRLASWSNVLEFGWARKGLSKSLIEKIPEH